MGDDLDTKLKAVLKKFFAEKRDWKRKDYNAYAQAIMDIKKAFKEDMKVVVTHPEGDGHCSCIYDVIDGNYLSVYKSTKEEL